MNKTQQEVLQLIFNGKFVRLEQEKVYDRDKNTWTKKSIPYYDDKATGKITNIRLLKTMPIRDKETGRIIGYHNETKEFGDGREHKKGASKIGAVVKELERKGYIIIHREIPAIEKIPLGGGRYGPDKPTTVSQVMYEITPAGRRQAKDTMMSEE